jgi:hypothetical protein
MAERQDVRRDDRERVSLRGSAVEARCELSTWSATQACWTIVATRISGVEYGGKTQWTAQRVFIGYLPGRRRICARLRRR